MQQDQTLSAGEETGAPGSAALPRQRLRSALGAVDIIGPVGARESAARALRGPVRLRTLTTLRWLAVAGQTAAVTTVHFGLGYPVALGLCLGAIAASAWLNLFTMLRFSPQHYLTDAEASASIGFDIIQLCVLLGLTGGLNNPFAALILAPVTIAASVLPMRATALIGALAFAGVTAVALFHLPLPWLPTGGLVLPKIYTLGIWVSLAFAVAFFSIYAHRIAAEAGQMKSALAATQLALTREEQLAAIGGLAAAAAHELGTPLATIQVTAKEIAEEVRAGGDIDLELLEEDARLLVSQAKRCREILARLSRQDVGGDDILDHASIDLLVKEASEPFGVGADAPAIMFEILAHATEGAPPVVRRMPEIIYGVRNFVENAAGFATSKVLVATSWTKDDITIFVLDDGPGFSAEVLARLGEPYLSARGRARAAASRKGGLGLGFFIAKTLIERTGGRVAFGNRRWETVAPAIADGATGAFVAIKWPRDAIEAPPAARTG
ncbi:MAG: ActS/PrrB/RegB family redox-sensitive histidine kinase [Alphaproteobacteria bacterium]|nr:ActS/PrrB/RegB family redox-sensitive histidine kinase [Alphaproteobacteria bacterium]